MLRILMTAVFAILCTQAIAQKNKKGDKGDDYIVMTNGDTIKGRIIYGTPAQRTVKIKFIEVGTKDERTYEPFQIKSFYSTELEGHFESKVLQFTASMDEGYGVFMQRLNKGAIRIYEYWNTFGERGFVQTYLQRGELERLTEVDYMRFNKQMIEYFDDFPQLSAKIERLAFKKKDLLKIVEEYNAWKNRGW